MEKNVTNFWNNHSYETWNLDFRFDVDPSCFPLDTMVELSVTFLELGMRYGLFYIIPVDVVDKIGPEQVLKDYRENARHYYQKVLSYNPNATHGIYFWPLFKDIVSNGGWRFVNAMTKLFLPSNGTQTIEYHGSFIWPDEWSNFENKKLEKPVYMESTLPFLSTGWRFYIGSQCDIWFDEIIYFTGDDDERSPFIIDNRMLAYLNTPRLNSFIRDIKILTQRLTGAVPLFCNENVYMNRAAITPDGILLDGHIIYQEDIDEGRVALPDWR